MNWLCRCGMHDWSYYGESVVVTWKEPPYGSGRTRPYGSRRIPMLTRGRKVFNKRRCLRCGIRMKRIMIKNADETFSSGGWEPLSEPEHEQDESKPPKRKITRRRMIR